MSFLTSKRCTMETEVQSERDKNLDVVKSTWSADTFPAHLKLYLCVRNPAKII